MRKHSKAPIFNTDILHLSISMGGVFTIISLIFINFIIGQFVFETKIVVLLLAIFIFLLSIFSVAMSFHSPKVQKICFGLLLVPLFIIGLNYNNIQKNTIDSEYTVIDKRLINSYSNINQTQIYKEFLANKENGDLKSLKIYKNNIDDYLSITAEQAMNLQLFYSSVKNEKIRSKLDSIFEDKLVTKSEFVDFQKFVSNLNLTPQEIAMITVVSK